MKKIYLLSLLLMASTIAIAQPSNDDCDAPILLEEIDNWCSAEAAFTNEDATPSDRQWVACSGNENDVWFAFRARATDVRLIVRGAVSGASGGTLRRPEITLFGEACGVQDDMDNIRCEGSGFGTHVVELYQGGLIIGNTYLIRVQGENGNTGTFQLCLNNFNAPPSPGSDLNIAAELCDKSSFDVENVQGGGTDNTEIDGASCFGGIFATNIESNSTWFVWVADEPGTLTFSLNPLNPSDDLDFVLFELPDGLDNLNNKEIIRCMASGETAGLESSRCLGPTGLRDGETDTEEDSGCSQGDDNAWLAPVNMETGKAYALVVNNFSSGDSGFNIEFGGTGTFLGPEPEIQVNTTDLKICPGGQIEFTDASSSTVGSIKNWTWDFGATASPDVANGPGPHNITFNEAGMHKVILTIETDGGCIKTEELFIEVTELEVAYNTTQPNCGIANGAIEMVIDGGVPPFSYTWNTGATGATIDNILEGQYSVTIQDSESCEIVTDITLEAKGLALRADIEPVRMPSCAGEADGQIIIEIEQGTPPYQYDFGSGVGSNNIQDSVAAGVYLVRVQDANDCYEEFTIEVSEPAPLSIDLEGVDISCSGQTDGEIIAAVGGGTGTYQYNWDNGSTERILTNLSEGTYAVTVNDVNNCTITASTTIIEPQGLDIELLDVIDVVCNGDATGEIVVNPIGGTPPFEYSIGNDDFSPTLTNIPAGDYTVTVRDARGCTADLEASVSEPEPILVDAGEDQTIELGYETDISATITPYSNLLTFNWEANEQGEITCEDCPITDVKPFNTTTYTIRVIDPNNCEFSDFVTVYVEQNRPVYVPNIFTPNDDGVNDYFILFGGPAVKNIKSLQVFNRWGDLVFKGENLPMGEKSYGWDGTYKGQPLQAGVFAFIAEVSFIDDSTLLFEGDVTLVR